MGRGNLVFSSHFVILVSRKNNFNMNWWFVFLFISIATLFPRIDSSEMSCAVCGDSPGKWNEIADRSICSLMDHFWNDSHDYFNEATNSRNFNYWPQAHALDVLVDAYLRTGDRRYKKYMDRWRTGVRIQNGNTFLNEYYDDMEWNALAMLRAYQVTGEEGFKNDVDTIWQDIKKGWNSIMGGGIAWRKSQLYYKNTPANAPAAILAARLYREFGNEEDKEWVLKIYEWLKDVLYDDESGRVYDGINSENDGRRNETWKFTYNQGTFIGMTLELYEITGEKSFLEEAITAADYTLRDPVLTPPPEHILRDEGGGDGGLFKGVFIRYFTKLILSNDLPLSKKDEYLAYLRRNAAVLEEKGIQEDDFLFGSYWSKKPGSTTDLTIQLSGAMLLEAMALLEKKGWL